MRFLGFAFPLLVGILIITAYKPAFAEEQPFSEKSNIQLILSKGDISLEKKLKEIVIPHISFSKVSLSEMAVQLNESLKAKKSKFEGKELEIRLKIDTSKMNPEEKISADIYLEEIPLYYAICAMTEISMLIHGSDLKWWTEGNEIVISNLNPPLEIIESQARKRDAFKAKMAAERRERQAVNGNMKKLVSKLFVIEADFEMFSAEEALKRICENCVFEGKRIPLEHTFSLSRDLNGEIGHVSSISMHLRMEPLKKALDIFCEQAGLDWEADASGIWCGDREGLETVALKAIPTNKNAISAIAGASFDDPQFDIKLTKAFSERSIRFGRFERIWNFNKETCNLMALVSDDNEKLIKEYLKTVDKKAE